MEAGGRAMKPGSDSLGRLNGVDTFGRPAWGDTAVTIAWLLLSQGR
jgi:hypothetical protein